MSQSEIQTATFANGCFWCSEAVFQKLGGVREITSGFTGGHIKNPAYREVIQGNTGHAEAIQLEYDPEKISYRDLLLVFFTTHDPTSLNRQGNDVGTQYRSVIFYHSKEQKEIAEKTIEELNRSHYHGNLVTEVENASGFYKAEDPHQNFYQRNRNHPYCELVIDPKIKKLKELYSDKLNN